MLVAKALRARFERCVSFIKTWQCMSLMRKMAGLACPFMLSGSWHEGHAMPQPSALVAGAWKIKEARCNQKTDLVQLRKDVSSGADRCLRQYCASASCRLGWLSPGTHGVSVMGSVIRSFAAAVTA